MGIIYSTFHEFLDQIENRYKPQKVRLQSQRTNSPTKISLTDRCVRINISIILESLCGLIIFRPKNAFIQKILYARLNLIIIRISRNTSNEYLFIIGIGFLRVTII